MNSNFVIGEVYVYEEYGQLLIFEVTELNANIVYCSRVFGTHLFMVMDWFYNDEVFVRDVFVLMPSNYENIIEKIFSIG